jgi:hypothetical protein
VSFHALNYGSFSGKIPTDMNGFAHTTQAGWMRAPMDWGTEYLRRGARAARLERCAELAAETRAAVNAADKALAKWRMGVAK